MKLFAISLFCLVFFTATSAQTIKFSGTIFDYNGAVVVGARVTATRKKSDSPISAKSNEDGQFQIDLKSGLYSLEISGNGFLTIKYPEYLVVNAPSGMKMDFVMFGSRYHEPCGVGGGDCLPARLLIKEFTIKYSPQMKQIREDFTDLNNKK